MSAPHIQLPELEKAASNASDLVDKDPGVHATFLPGLALRRVVTEAELTEEKELADAGYSQVKKATGKHAVEDQHNEIVS